MRFSLRSLLLVTFWFATAGLVWHRWFPWQHTVFPNGAPTLSAEQFSRQYPTWQDGKPYEELKSPDGTRRKENGHGSPHSLLLDQRTDEVLCVLPVAEGFLDDNHIVCLDFTITSDGDFVWGDRYLIKRRHPEWWWGHFYRPEVWALMGLSCVMVWLTVRGLKRRGSIILYRGHAAGWELLYDGTHVANLHFSEWEDIHRYFFKIEKLVGFDFNALNSDDLDKVTLRNKVTGEVVDSSGFNICFSEPDSILIRDLR